MAANPPGNPPGAPPGAPPAGTPPGGKPPGPGRPREPQVWHPNEPVPPDLKFQMVGDLVVLDHATMQAAMAAIKGNSIPVPLLQLIYSNPQVQDFIMQIIAGYPVGAGCVFNIAAGYVLHASAAKQQMLRSMVSTTKPRLV